MVRIVVWVVLLALVWGERSAGQTLPDSTIDHLRAGAAWLELDADSVSVPIHMDRGVPFVDAMLNGRGPYRFLIDLGSNVVILRRNVLDESRSVLLYDRESSDIGAVAEVRVGGATWGRVVAGVYDELDVDGVLGFNVLRHGSFTLDYSERELAFHEVELPPPDGRGVLSFSVFGRMPFVDVEIGGRVLSMNLDTGAAEVATIPPSMTDSLSWQEAPLPGRSTSNNQTGVTRVLEGIAAGTLRVGPLEVVAPRVFVNPDADAAWLGSAALLGTSWTFDVDRNRVLVRLDRN